MASHAVLKVFKPLQNFSSKSIVLGVLGIGLACSAAEAKEVSLTAIELYDGATGAAYAQLGDVLINGKTELRDCSSSEASPIDKSGYGKLPKVTVSVGGVLARGADGILRYSAAGGRGICVIPENVKFEHNASLLPSAIIDSTDLKGRLLAPASDGATAPAQLKKGVSLFFVAAPDAEFAEFLLASRVGTVPGWRGYLDKYPATAHTGDAKRQLATLYVSAGESSLNSYVMTAGTPSPAFAALKDAKVQANLARALLPDIESLGKLTNQIRASLSTLADKGRAELDAYSAALSSHQPGYAHLQAAENLSTAITGVDPDFAPGKKLMNDVVQARNVFDSALRSGGSASDAKQLDDALQFILPYRAFAEEEPRVAHIIDADYAFHFDRGKQAQAAQDWQTAIQEFRKAAAAKESAEVRDLLKEAEGKLVVSQDETAAKAALEKSKNFELQKDMIEAYEVLSSLPPSQQAIVADEIKRLAPAYVLAASQRAKELTKAYQTIQGIGDERQVERAYTFLQRAVQLSDDETAKEGYKTRMDNLGDELSTWFVERAKHYLDKPLGSGTELGWAYLKEAESYRAANLEGVRDELKKAESAHGMHSKLSIRVQFRDQTSQRQSEGFREQLESAVITGLDTSGLPVRVLKFGETVSGGADPDFQLAGDVLEHHISAPPTVESVDSNYTAGVHEIPSEEYNKVNRVYDSASSELHTAQAALQGAEAKGNKKEINEQSRKVADAQKKVDDARVLLDSIAKSKTEDIIRSYTYKKTTYDVNERVNLQFRIDDTLTGQKGEPVEVSKLDHKQYVVLSDVKPEDTNHVKSQGTIPDTFELLTELENAVRTELIAKVREKVAELPRKIVEGARKKEDDSYPDDAGEAYLRFLNVTAADQSAERQHAEKFLREQFNFPTFPGIVQ